MSPALRKVIDKVPAGDWAPIPYWLEGGADVAETTYKAFGNKALRLIVRRVKPTPGSQLALFTDYEYHAFVTDREGTTVALEADHRRHAEVELVIRDLKDGLWAHMPSGRFGANAAWLALGAIAHNLARWAARLGGITDRGGPVALSTLRRRYICVPGHLSRSARRTTLHLVKGWPWAEAFLGRARQSLAGRDATARLSPAPSPTERSEGGSARPARPDGAREATDGHRTPHPGRFPTTTACAVPWQPGLPGHCPHPFLDFQALLEDHPLPIGGSRLRLCRPSAHGSPGTERFAAHRGHQPVARWSCRGADASTR